MFAARISDKRMLKLIRAFLTAGVFFDERLAGVARQLGKRGGGLLGRRLRTTVTTRNEIYATSHLASRTGCLEESDGTIDRNSDGIQAHDRIALGVCASPGIRHAGDHISSCAGASDMYA
jgi:hypothetical protein